MKNAKMRRITGKGWLPAKLAKDLKPGDVIVRPFAPDTVVKDVRRGEYNVFIRVEGVSTPTHLAMYRRLNTKVAIGGRMDDRSLKEARRIAWRDRQRNAAQITAAFQITGIQAGFQ